MSSPVRIYADIAPELDQQMKMVCVQLDITRKKFLEEVIAQGITEAKAAIAAGKRNLAVSHKR